MYNRYLRSVKNWSPLPLVPALALAKSKLASSQLLLDQELTFKLSQDCSLQSVDDGAVILRVTDGQIYSCNETTLAFLKLVDGKRSFPEIVSAFRQEYQVDEETASSDLAALAQDMLAEGVIVQVN